MEAIRGINCPLFVLNTVETDRLDRLYGKMSENGIFNFCNCFSMYVAVCVDVTVSVSCPSSTLILSFTNYFLIDR